MLGDAEILRRIGEEFTQRKKRLVVATTHIYARYVLRSVIEDYMRLHPDVQLALRQGNPAQIAQWVAAGDAEGFVKVITDAASGEILGVHILGNEAPELIAEYVLAMNMEGTAEEVHRAIHAHPTLSEALMEAAAATSGEAIHI